MDKITEYYHKQLEDMKQNETLKLWVARDKAGLYLFRETPKKDEKNPEYWDTPYHGYLQIRGDRFPFVTFENSPQQVELKLIEE